MAAKDYRLMLRASLDPSGLDKEIEAVSKKYKLNLQVNVDKTSLDEIDKKVQSIQNKTSSGGSKQIRLIDAEHDEQALIAIEKKIAEIQAASGNLAKYSITTGAGGEEPTKAIVSYTDAMNKKVSATYQWVNAAKEGEKVNMVWAETTNKLTHNIEAEEKALAKAIQRAKEFIEKSKTLNQSNPSVQNATGIAKQMLTETDPAKMKALNDQLSIYQKGINGATTGTRSFTAEMASSMRRTVEYSLSIGLLYSALNQLRQGLQYVIDLNKEMTNIQLVTGASTEEINSMAQGYNNLAKEMGATTLEVAKGSLEFIRQGKTAEETQVLITNSMMMSKLANMESAESSEALTSIMNGFKMEVNETGDAVSKLVAIDNIAATSVAELSTAMRYTANSANQVGVDFDHLAAYIGTVSSVTRLSAETIGQAFKTIFARMTSIKNLKAFDENGEAINKVESSLLRVGIHLRDNNGQFRDMQEVLGEIGDNWNNINKEDQLYIAEQIAGVRQKETFLVLMNNQLEMQKQLTAETKSHGLAEERYAIYLKSVEAAQNRMTASWEALATSGATADMISGFYNGLAAVLDLITALGGLKTILVVATVALGYFYKTQMLSALGVVTQFATQVYYLGLAFAGMASYTDLATASQWLLNLALDANPIGVVIGLIGVLVAGVYALTTAYNYLSKEIERTNEEYSKLKTSFDEAKTNADKMSELAERFEELRKNMGRTTAEQKEYIDIQNQIKDLLPQVAGKYDEMGNFMLATSVSAETLTASTKKLLDSEMEQMQLKLAEKLDLETQAFKKQSLEVEVLSWLMTNNLLEPLRAILKVINDVIVAGNPFIAIVEALNFKKVNEALNFDSTELLNKLKNQTEESANKIREDFYAITDETQQQLYLATLKSGGDWGRQLAEELSSSMVETVEKTKDDFDSMKMKIPVEVEVSPESQEAMDSLVENIVSMLKQIKEQEKANLKQQLSDYKNYIDEMKRGLKDTYELQKRQYDEEKKNIQRNHEDYNRQLEENFNLIKRQYEEEKKLLERNHDEKLNALKDEYDLIKKNLEEEKENAQKLYDQDKRNRDQKKESIQRELDDFKRIISAQKELLSLKKAESEYNKQKEEKQGALSDIESKIMSLSFDDSAEATAERLKLEESAADLRSEIADDEANHQYDLNVRALENEETLAEEQTRIRIQQLEEEQAAADARFELRLQEMEDAMEKAQLEYEDKVRIADQEFELRLQEMNDAMEKAQLEYEENKRISDLEYEMRMREMEDKQEKAQQEYDDQVRALEDAYKAKEDSLNKQIALIDDYLSKEGAMNKEAMDMLMDENSGVYQKLMEWNREYGTGIDQDIIQMWDLARAAVDAYSASLNSIPESPPITETSSGVGAVGTAGNADDIGDGGTGLGTSTGAGEFHSGVNSGFVGGKPKLKSNEQFAKLLKGEIVVNTKQMDNFMKSILPSTMSSPAITQPNNRQSLNFDKLMELNVSGNLDKTMLPDLEKIASKVVDKINDAMLNRGFNRRADLFAG